MRPIDADALIRKWCGIKCGRERDECDRERKPCLVVMAIEEAPTVGIKIDFCSLGEREDER